ncbi:hypothetical protein BC834DRAFT_901473 [Gloeopeniophorella convolvens]|nr:hypothetical protein BC834DRAFT_901473 [Gloeopeniophorella convolvens]
MSLSSAPCTPIAAYRFTPDGQYSPIIAYPDMNDEMLHQGDVLPVISVCSFESAVDSASGFVGRTMGELFRGATKASLVEIPVIVCTMFIVPRFSSSLPSAVISAPQNVKKHSTGATPDRNTVQRARQNAPIQQNNFFLINTGSDPTAIVDNVKQILRLSAPSGGAAEVAQLDSINKVQ